MEDKEELKKKLINFRDSLTNLSIAELETKATEIQNKISKMILDSDLMIEAAVVDALIKEKKEALEKADA